MDLCFQYHTLLGIVRIHFQLKIVFDLLISNLPAEYSWHSILEPYFIKNKQLIKVHGAKVRKQIQDLNFVTNIHSCLGQKLITMECQQKIYSAVIKPEDRLISSLGSILLYTQIEWNLPAMPSLYLIDSDQLVASEEW